MVPLVSNKYSYIFFYNPKSACSVARQLFLDLHREELSDQQRSSLSGLKDANQDEWHAINQLFPLEKDKDYSTYTKFTLVRHPLTRFVSAYLNRVVLEQMDLHPAEKFIKNKYGDEVEVNHSFNQFLDYFESLGAINISDNHFQPQAKISGVLSAHIVNTEYYPNNGLISKLNKLFSKKEVIDVLKLDHICKIESLQQDIANVYKDIFANHPNKQKQLMKILANLPLHNVTYTSIDKNDVAGSLSAAELRSLGKMPSYTSFLDPAAIQVLVEKYQLDFQLFNYSPNLDASVLEFEKQKSEDINSVVPDDFDWQHYLEKNADLGANGIDSKVSAISHWIHHGRFEQREYRKISN